MGNARGIVAAQGASQGSTEEVLLTIGGDVKPAVRFSAHDLSAFKRHTATVREHDQQASSYEGVLLTDLLEKTGLPVGKQLRGTALSLYLLFEAADGYKVVFALPELDPIFTDKIVLLADRRDGKPLSQREGPLRIIVPDEKRQARWIRQLKSIEVHRAGADVSKEKSP